MNSEESNPQPTARVADDFDGDYCDLKESNKVNIGKSSKIHARDKTTPKENIGPDETRNNSTLTRNESLPNQN